MNLAEGIQIIRDNCVYRTQLKHGLFLIHKELSGIRVIVAYRKFDSKTDRIEYVYLGEFKSRDPKIIFKTVLDDSYKFEGECDSISENELINEVHFTSEDFFHDDWQIAMYGTLRDLATEY